MSVLALMLIGVAPVEATSTLSGSCSEESAPHRCPSNQEVQAALREGRTIQELLRGAEQGCARCKSNMEWLQRHNQERYGVPASNHERSDFSPGTEEPKVSEPKATPPAARPQEQTSAPAQTVAPAQPAGAVPPHRCHSNQEVQAVIRGSATHRDVQYGASLGCPRCRENLIWWEERQQARDEALRTHVCPSNADVKVAIRGSATHKALIRGANVGCAKCRANLNWWNKRH